MKIIVLIIIGVIACAIFGTAFLAAIASFVFSLFMKIFNIAFQASGCLIRLGFLLLLFLLACWLAKGG